MPNKGITKREFIQTVGAGTPTMLALTQSLGAAQIVAGRAVATPKAEPIDRLKYFNASSVEFGLRDQAAGLSRESAQDRLIRLPGGERILRGCAFCWVRRISSASRGLNSVRTAASA
jgi:hypothetical protein